MTREKVWFITGTSSGLGRALAEAVIAHGEKVVGTTRQAGANQDLVERAPDRVSMLQLDVTQYEHIDAVVRKAREAFGRIDVLVNNAGYGLFGGAEEVTDEQLRRQIETNLIGSIQVIRAVLPLLREQGSGHIIQISSAFGLVAVPGLSLYHAAKWGIEGFCEALAGEVASLGIQVTLIEPGGIRTDFSGRSMDFATPLGAYAQTAIVQMRDRLLTISNSLGDPVKMAEAIVSIASQTSAPLRLTLGSDAYQFVRATLQARLAALDAQEALARSTDVDVIAGDVR